MLTLKVFFLLLGYILGARHEVFGTKMTILVVLMAILLTVAYIEGVSNDAMYMNAEAALKEAKFAIAAVVTFVIATSIGVTYMLASGPERDTLHEAIEQYFNAV